MSTQQNIPHMPLSTNAEELKRFWDSLKARNEVRHDRVKKAVQYCLGCDPLPKWIAIGTTGSDGRYENKDFDSHDNKTGSNIEIVILWLPTEVSRSVAHHTYERVRDVIGLSHDGGEIKMVGEDDLIRYENKTDLVFPTRIWDFVGLAGDEMLRVNIRRYLSDAIVEDPSVSQRFARRLRYHKHVMKTGQSTFRWDTHEQYNLDTGTISFDPAHHNFSVKTGPLRVIQYSLALALIRHIRNAGEHPGFVDALPTNIAERIDFLLSNKLTKLSRRECEELRFIYTFFLKTYNQLQYAYLYHGQTQFSIHPDTLKDMRWMLDALSRTLVIDRILI